MASRTTYELPNGWPAQLMPTVGPLTDAETQAGAVVGGPRTNLYARRSPGPKEERLESVDRQIDRLLPVAERLGYPLECVVRDRDMSAVTVRFQRRPKARALIQGLRAGDWLLVAALDRLERGMRNQLNTLEWLKSRKIRVYVLDFLDRELDPNDDGTTLMVNILALTSELEGSTRKGRMRHALNYMREHGIPLNQQRRFGERRIMVRAEGTDKLVVLRRERSQPELDLLRSIHDRVRLGNDSLLGLYKTEGHTWRNAEGERVSRQQWGVMVQWYADELAKGRSPATEPVIYHTELKKEK